MTVRVIDTFLFDGDWVARVRLALLAPFVDEFVIVEARETFSGERKQFLYKDKWSEWFRPYEHKVHWVVVDSFPEATEEWRRVYGKHPLCAERGERAWFAEHYQRDAAVRYIREKYAGEDYIVSVGDADELPATDIFHPDARPTMRSKLREIGGPLFLEMVYYFYNFYWRKPHHWYRAFILGKAQLESTPSLACWRYGVVPDMVLRQAGWHLCLFMEVADIQRRLGGALSAGHVKECIAQGKDLLGRGGKEHLLLHEDDDFSKLPEPLASCRGELDYLQMS